MKFERHKYILNKLEEDNTITVSEIVNALNVTDMTIRRDFAELEEKNLLRRIHGGAICINSKTGIELSHEEKKILNIKDKNYVTDIALRFINDGDIIFLGPGTTIELMADKINHSNITIVTNCLPVFNKLLNKELNIYLIGGEIRRKTQAFNGDMTLSTLETLKFNKAFFSCNAVNGNEAMTATIAEGKVQATALDNSKQKYLIIDSNKINKQDFYTYYKLEDLTAVITNDDKYHLYKEIENHTKVIIK